MLLRTTRFWNNLNRVRKIKY